MYWMLKKKLSRSVIAASVVMANGKLGKRRKRSRYVKEKKEEMKGCFEVMKLKKL